MTVMYKIILIVNFLAVSILSFEIREVVVKIDYNKTNAIVQYCLNDLLSILEVNVQVMRKPKLRLLAVMQNNLNNIVHYKWKVHSEMQNIARAESFNMPVKLYEYIEAAISDIGIKNQNNITQVTNETSTDLETNDFYAELLNQINSQNIMIENNNNVSIDNQGPENIYRRKMNDDLEIWEPDENLENHARRVYGGKPVGIIQYPFVVSIHVLGKFTGTGCIINKNLVITAASCLQPTTMYGGDQSPIQIRIGSEHTSFGGDFLPAFAVIFHPRYNSVSLENNLAIIKVKNIMHSVKRPATKKIRIGSLPENLPTNFANKGVFVLGWSNVSNEIHRNNQLSSAFLEMTSLDECMDVYAKHLVTSRHFCAGLTYKGSGACNGDTGSPAIVLGTLVGLVNFGPPNCGTVLSPTVFTKVAPYSIWINDVIRQETQRFHYKSESMFTFEDSNINVAESQEPPEEILILRQLVHEIDKPNNTLAQIIEEDKEIDDEMKIIFQTSTTAVDAPHHLLVNRSIVLVPGIHLPNYVTEAHHVNVTPHVTQSVIDIGLPEHLPYDAINNIVQNSDELRYYVHDILHEGTIFKPEEVQGQLGVLDLRTESKKKNYNNGESESNDNFEYESYEGLSIEAPKIEKDQSSTDYGTESRSEDKGTVMDLGNHNVKLGMKSNKKHSKLHKDVWSEVMRLNELKKKRKPMTEQESKRFRSIRVPKPL